MTSNFKAKILVCVECGQEFVFTVAAQEYFAERGFTEDPKRCKHCYVTHKRNKRNNSNGDRYPYDSRKHLAVDRDDSKSESDAREGDAVGYPHDETAEDEFYRD